MLVNERLFHVSRQWHSQPDPLVILVFLTMIQHFGILETSSISWVQQRKAPAWPPVTRWCTNRVVKPLLSNALRWVIGVKVQRISVQGGNEVIPVCSKFDVCNIWRDVSMWTQMQRHSSYGWVVMRSRSSTAVLLYPFHLTTEHIWSIEYADKAR